jgi:serine protease Do
MKQSWIKLPLLAIAFACCAPALAQKEDKEKVKDVKEKKEVEQIIITRKNGDNEKVVIEINGDKITVNGKPIDEYKDKDGNVTVRRSRHSNDYTALNEFNVFNRGNNGVTWNMDNKMLDNLKLFSMDSNRAMLGVTTEKVENGVEIQSVTKESAAEKSGLKEKDIITKVGDVVIVTPDDLSGVIQKHKPGEKVSITYMRDKKEQKTTAELGRWKGMAFNGNYKMDLGDMNFGDLMPKVQTTPRTRMPYAYSGGGPKLGLSVQDTDDGKGVKIIEVDNESNAQKAGLKNDDVIMEVDGKAVNGADAMAKVIRESKDKNSVLMKISRSGKTQNIEVKIPRKLKTADF